MRPRISLGDRVVVDTPDERTFNRRAGFVVGKYQGQLLVEIDLDGAAHAGQTVPFDAQELIVA